MSILSSIKSAVKKGVSNLVGNVKALTGNTTIKSYTPTPAQKAAANYTGAIPTTKSIIGSSSAINNMSIGGVTTPNFSVPVSKTMPSSSLNAPAKAALARATPSPSSPSSPSVSSSGSTSGGSSSSLPTTTISPAAILGLNQTYNPQGIVNVSNTPITTSELSGSNVAPNIGSAPVNTNDVGQVDKAKAMLETDEKINKENKKEEKTTADETLEKFMGMKPERPEVPDQYQTDLDESRKYKNEIKTQLAMANAELENQLMAIRQIGSQEGVTEGVYGAQEMQIRRQSAMKIMTLTAQYQAAVENYNTAKEIVSDWVTQENAYLNRYWSWQNNIFDKALSYTSGKERDAVLDARYEKEQAVKKAEGRKNDLLDLYKIASENKDKQTMQYIAGLITQSDSMDDKTYDTMYGNAMSKVKLGTTGSDLFGSLPISTQNKIISSAEEFNGRKEVQKFIATVDAANVLNIVDPKSKNPADHQQIVYGFAKALDPESVVRGEEYEAVKKYAQSLYNRYKGEISNAFNGTGFLSEKAISDIQSTIDNLYKARLPIYQNAYNEKTRTINNIAGFDVASKLIEGKTGGYTPKNNTSPTTILKTGDTGETSSGLKYTIE